MIQATPPKQLVDFQMQFGAWLRNPEAARPDSVPERSANLYAELVFNNLSGFLNACFPICRSLVEPSAWMRLSRQFFRDWQSHAPLFHEIPGEFLAYLQENQPSLIQEYELPEWFLALAHYEWAELAVDTHPYNNRQPGNHTDSLTETIVQINPTLMNLAYQWPVHKISQAWQPKEIEPTYLAVYRTSESRVNFTELNPMSSALLAYIGEQPANPEQILEGFATQLNHPSPAQLQQHGRALIDEFIVLGLLVSAPVTND